MNTLGATSPGLRAATDTTASRPLGLAGMDEPGALFGAVLGALGTSAAPEAPPAADPERPAGRRAEDDPEEGPLSNARAESQNPLDLLAAVSPVPQPGAAPARAPARDSLETLVARALPNPPTALGRADPISELVTGPVEAPALPHAAAADPMAGSAVPDLRAGMTEILASASASAAVPEARTRVTVLRRETHFAPVLPRRLAATPVETAPAGSVPGGVAPALASATSLPGAMAAPSAAPAPSPGGQPPSPLATMRAEPVASASPMPAPRPAAGDTTFEPASPASPRTTAIPDGGPDGVPASSAIRAGAADSLTPRAAMPAPEAAFLPTPPTTPALDAASPVEVTQAPARSATSRTASQSGIDLAGTPASDVPVIRPAPPARIEAAPPVSRVSADPPASTGDVPPLPAAALRSALDSAALHQAPTGTSIREAAQPIAVDGPDALQERTASPDLGVAASRTTTPAGIEPANADPVRTGFAGRPEIAERGVVSAPGTHPAPEIEPVRAIVAPTVSGTDTVSASPSREPMGVDAAIPNPARETRPATSVERSAASRPAPLVNPALPPQPSPPLEDRIDAPPTMSPASVESPASVDAALAFVPAASAGLASVSNDDPLSPLVTGTPISINREVRQEAPALAPSDTAQPTIGEPSHSAQAMRAFSPKGAPPPSTDSPPVLGRTLDQAPALSDPEPDAGPQGSRPSVSGVSIPPVSEAPARDPLESPRTVLAPPVEPEATRVPTGRLASESQVASATASLSWTTAETIPPGASTTAPAPSELSRAGRSAPQAVPEIPAESQISQAGETESPASFTRAAGDPLLDATGYSLLPERFDARQPASQRPLAVVSETMAASQDPMRAELVSTGAAVERAVPPTSALNVERVDAPTGPVPTLSAAGPAGLSTPPGFDQPIPARTAILPGTDAENVRNFAASAPSLPRVPATPTVLDASAGVSAPLPRPTVEPTIVPAQTPREPVDVVAAVLAEPVPSPDATLPIPEEVNPPRASSEPVHSVLSPVVPASEPRTDLAPLRLSDPVRDAAAADPVPLGVAPAPIANHDPVPSVEAGTPTAAATAPLPASPPAEVPMRSLPVAPAPSDPALASAAPAVPQARADAAPPAIPLSPQAGARSTADVGPDDRDGDPARERRAEPAPPVAASETDTPVRDGASAPRSEPGSQAVSGGPGAPLANMSLAGAPPPLASTPPAQQLASAILGQMPRAPSGTVPHAPGLDGPLRLLTLQLHPADLGMVQVRMRLRDGHLEMSLQASREETATLLREGGEVLADLLRQGGYQPERVTIVSGPLPNGSTPGEGQAFAAQGEGAGSEQATHDQPDRRQSDGRASPDTSNERTHESVSNSPDRSGVYL